MPRCGCAGSSCTCLVQGGEGIAVEGAGTADNPYIISTDGLDISDALTFNDTPSVNFTVLGEGTEADPYVVSAVATPSMGDLSNVDCDIAPAGMTLISDGEKWQCGIPQLALNDLTDVNAADAGGNEVLTYNATTGQWEPGVVSVEPGQVNTAHGAMGDGTASAPVSVQTAAEWGEGELADLPAGGQEQDGGIPVFIDTLGNVRTPRGLYLLQTDPEAAGFDPYSQPALFRNPGTVMVGSLDDPTYRTFAVARGSEDGSVFGGALLFTTFQSPLTTGGIKVSSVSERTDPSDSDTDAAIHYFRSDGQRYHRTLDSEGIGTTRYEPFAWAFGATEHAGAANSGRPVVVTFPTRRFTGVPWVFLQVLTGTQNAGATNTEAWPSGVSATSMTVYCNRSNSTDVTVRWMAVQASRELPGEMVAAGERSGPPGEEPSPQDGLATCHTPGCENEGVPIVVPTHYDDGDGNMLPLTNYQCGECGEPITDVQEIS